METRSFYPHSSSDPVHRPSPTYTYARASRRVLLRDHVLRASLSFVCIKVSPFGTTVSCAHISPYTRAARILQSTRLRGTDNMLFSVLSTPQMTHTHRAKEGNLILAGWRFNEARYAPEIYRKTIKIGVSVERPSAIYLTDKTLRTVSAFCNGVVRADGGHQSCVAFGGTSGVQGHQDFEARTSIFPWFMR